MTTTWTPQPLPAAVLTLAEVWHIDDDGTERFIAMTDDADTQARYAAAGYLVVQIH
jgi:negative regulator of genetic competence, sporulation and motility